MRRDVYALVSELILDDDDEASRELKAGGILEGLHAVKDSFDPSDSAYEAVMEVQKEDIFVTILKMGYGSNGNPVDRVAFYLPGKSSPSDLSCSQDSQSTLNGNGGGGGSSSQGSMVDVETVDVGAIERDNLSRLLPVRFEERVCRVYCSRKSQKRGLTAIFNRWVENTQGKPPPTPLSPPRWRLACKAIVDPNLQADAADLVVKVTPRGFDGFYGVEECNLDGEPLQRPGQK